MKHHYFSLCALVALLASAATLHAEDFKTLWGTKAKVDAAFQHATNLNLTRVTDAAQLNRFVKLGLLVRLTGNRHYRLHDVTSPYLRPAAKLLVERLAEQYYAEFREQLVVTSALRTLAHSAGVWNASQKSVHPAGIAVDFRIPQNADAKAWLENTFLTLQAREVIIATRETNPPHYHIVVFPVRYQDYVTAKLARR